MFDGAYAFNQPLNNWDVSGASNFFGMFYECSVFNQPLNNWTVDSATTMQSMFDNALAFDQPLSNWDVSNVEDFKYMFYGATQFDQDLGAWDISSATMMNDMFKYDTLSPANYDSTLIGWARLDPGELQIPANIVFGGGDSHYCAGESARDSLITVYNWTITDGGRLCSSYWTGAVSDDWFTSGNWTDGVPDDQINAIIPDVGLNPYPVINTTGAVCAFLDLQPGTSLTVLSTGVLTVVSQN